MIRDGKPIDFLLDSATLKRLDQPVEYLDSAAYGRFMLEEIERDDWYPDPLH